MLTATSVNGWPALNASSPQLHTWTVRDAKQRHEVTRLRLRHGAAGFLLVHLAMWFDDRIEDVQDNYRDGELDDWGFAFRPVRGFTTSLSNHSSGTAMDLNATDHVLARRGTFTDSEEAMIQRRLDYYQGCIRWGGDYVSRADEMHFEIDRTLAACEGVARGLLDTWRGKRVLRDNPEQKAVILS